MLTLNRNYKTPLSLIYEVEEKLVTIAVVAAPKMAMSERTET